MSPEIFEDIGAIRSAENNEALENESAVLKLISARIIKLSGKILSMQLDAADGMIMKPAEIEAAREKIEALQTQVVELTDEKMIRDEKTKAILAQLESLEAAFTSKPETN